MNNAESRIKNICVQKGLTLAVAESCTGGLISHRLTNVSGSSAYFTAGIVSYANEAKMRLLGVRAATLRRYGAVSEQTAREMARGVRRACGAAIGVAVTGIAGPAGGTPEKPVGLVYMAVASARRETAKKCTFAGARLQIKKQSADAALTLLHRCIT